MNNIIITDNVLTDWFISLYSAIHSSTKSEDKLLEHNRQKLEDIKNRINPVLSDCLELDLIEEINYQYKLDIKKEYIIQVNVKHHTKDYTKWLCDCDWRYSDSRKFVFSYGNVLQGISYNYSDAKDKAEEVLKWERKDSRITLVPVYISHHGRHLTLYGLLKDAIEHKIIDVNIK